MSAKGIGVAAALAVAALAIAKGPEYLAGEISKNVNSRPLRSRAVIAWRVLRAKL